MSETNKTYRNAGLYSFGDGFNILNSAPIDSRTYVSNITDIYDDANWAGIGVKPYPGLIVSAPSGDVKIYVGPTISKITDITDSTEQIGWRNKENWLDVNIPQFDESDAGRLLTIVETTNDDQTTSYSAQWVDAPSGLPTINGTSDANKVLQVNTEGTGVTWVDAPEELPTITADEKGKILAVVETEGEDGSKSYSAQWNDIPKQIPPYHNIDDDGKVLTVSSDGLEWSTVDTSFMKSVTTDELFEFANRGGLKPGMKYRITDYNPNIDANYTRKINGDVTNIASSEVKFDIIVTASSESTLFDDVELVSKVAGPDATFDYTKYEAKYDLVGNRDGFKYGYIQSSAAGVIYYMKDQFGNEASYDFENIIYVGIIHGVMVHTFSGVKNGDLRASGLIQNVRIKHNPSDLPGVIFVTSSRYGRMFINDVELDNCDGAYFEDTNLRHVKISNSQGINFIMGTAVEHQYCPLFENLNICNNETLTINCSSEFNGAFEELNGLHINNLNILPSFTSKLINVADLLSQTSEIVVQGLYDSNIASKLRITPETGAWTIALLEQNENAYRLIFGRSESTRINLAGAKWDLFIYDSILNASKNIKPFDIFNPSKDDGSLRDYTLEIPQFQSTATSVVELGI